MIDTVSKKMKPRGVDEVVATETEPQAVLCRLLDEADQTEMEKKQAEVPPAKPGEVPQRRLRPRPYALD